MARVFVLVAVISGVFCQNKEVENFKFPPGFLFGTGSAAVQIEGAWNQDGKGESGWDYFVHHHPDRVIDGSNSDVACDSYHLYKGDIPFVKMAGMNTYRFSLSWSRLLPTGDPNNVNQLAVNYYNNLINEVLSYNISPVVTMHHYDLPLNLTKLGGWANRDTILHFVAYAEFVLNTFGDRVKYWLTVNEPMEHCVGGYGLSVIAPGTNMSGIADYLCVHHLLLAHAQVYRMYKLMPDNIKAGGKMGFTSGYRTFYPWNKFNLLDQAASNLAHEFVNGWVLNPVFGSGDYPQALRDQVDLNSAREGRKVSRLPRFTPEEIILIKGSADFLGLNQYTGYFATFLNLCPHNPLRKFNSDMTVYGCPKPGYDEAEGKFMQVVPGSLKRALTQVREKYNNVPVLITENGYPDSPSENLTYNPARQSFFQSTISDVFGGLKDGSNLLGYLVWSLLDSFEWNSGYTLKFGIVHVDMADKNRKRTVKAIANFFRDVAEYGLNKTTI